MDLSSLQQTRKLKKVETNDKSGPVLHDREEEVFAFVQKCNVEYNYEYIKEVTFPTLWFDLTVEEASIIANAHCGGVEVLSPKDRTSMDSLAERMNAIIEENFPSGAFVRTSTRSPKDSMVARKKTAAFISKTLSPASDLNDKLTALMRGNFLGMMVKSGYEALELLLTSDRIRVDLERSLEHLDAFEQRVILREWIDLPIHAEWRCFVHEEKVTALCQYHYFLYLPEVVDNAETIKQRICEFSEDLVPSLRPLEMTSYVLDLAVLDDGTVLVVELNPFYEGTGANLFSWKTDRDVLEGRAATCPEMRVVSEKMNKLSVAEETAMEEDLLSINPHALSFYPEFKCV